MLRWRLSLGSLLTVVVLGLFWLDAHSPISGIVFVPIIGICMVMATHEVLDLLEASGMKPKRWVVHASNFFILASSWGACLWRDMSEQWIVLQGQVGVGEALSEPTRHDWLWSTEACVWTLLALSGGVLLAFYAEMRRFVKPGGVMINLAGAVFAMTYIGMMAGFMIQLRMAWGIMALASLIVVVKMADVGAYTVGRLIGRNKMAPDLSPGKTIEGALGGLLFACIGSWISLSIVPDYKSTVIGIITYGIIVGMAGMAGDLAESLIKRDAMMKDSSRWLPGFGGVLDLVDSVLLAAPVAYAWWALGLVGSVA